ncbi:MAG: molecular chaperone DnaJ [Deltaproteobacteria bacterium RIFOXYD12_FULL_50_9]|nr:MAG: molecular chaperone DnaJ [Deltaproteobacteria bacterium RIFOXYD12_FULL_50_9]
MEYRTHKSPGCGGCLLILAMLALITGGAPALLQLLGVLFFTGLFFIFALVAFFWGVFFLIRRKVSSYEQSQTQTHNVFVFLLVNILVKIAQVDAKVTREEINTIVSFFRTHLHYNQSQIFWVRDLIKEALASHLSLEVLLTDFKNRFPYEPRLILLELIYQVIYSAEVVLSTAPELAVAQQIALFLEITEYDHLSIRSRYMARARAAVTNEERYYQVLGLEQSASFEEIKSAYRKLSMKYHPDKVGHLGEEFRKVSEEKMKELNEAYQYFKKKFA